MGTTGPGVFDRTLQESSHWLKLMMGGLGSDSRHAEFGALHHLLPHQSLTPWHEGPLR